MESLSRWQRILMALRKLYEWCLTFALFLYDEHSGCSSLGEDGEKGYLFVVIYNDSITL